MAPRARKADAYAEYLEIISAHGDKHGASHDERPYWDQKGLPCLAYDLLVQLLSRSVKNSDSVQSGRFAKVLDLWIAEELRAAGFSENSVWPRRYVPRALSPEVFSFIQSLPPHIAEQCCKELPNYASADASVLGSTYKKQVDVGMSSWLTGPEILISTKTMSSSFGKNLNNRFEEAYGDAKNLKGRHPLASLGFFFVVRSTILEEPANLRKAVAMLEKLQFEEDAYDATAMLIVRWGEDGEVTIAPENELLPPCIGPRFFFKSIIESTLRRSALDDHQLAKSKHGLVAMH